MSTIENVMKFLLSDGHGGPTGYTPYKTREKPVPDVWARMGTPGQHVRRQGSVIYVPSYVWRNAWRESGMK